MVRPINISSVLQSLDMLGRSNQRYAQLEMQKRQKDISSGSAIGGTIGGIVGSYYGGPAGGAAGGAIGSAIGGEVAGGGTDDAQIAQSGVQGYQMGANMQQQKKQQAATQRQNQQNQQFNNSFSQSILAKDDLTPQQRQFAEGIADSTQSPTTTMKQSQFLNLDPNTLTLRAANSDVNTTNISRAKSILQNRMSSLDEKSAEYQNLQSSFERLEGLEEKDLGVYKPEYIEKQITREIPTRTEIRRDTDSGKVLAITTNEYTGQEVKKSLGDIPKGKEDEIISVPYRDRSGEPRVKNFLNQKEALIFAEKHGTKPLSKGQSIFLTQLAEEGKAARSSSGKDSVEYRVTTDIDNKREEIIDRLTVTTPADEEIKPSSYQVNKELKNDLSRMAVSTTGRERQVIKSQLEALNKEIKNFEQQATSEFVNNVDDYTSTPEETQRAIEATQKIGPPEGVDKQKALTALRNLKKRQEKAIADNINTSPTSAAQRSAGILDTVHPGFPYGQSFLN